MESHGETPNSLPNQLFSPCIDGKKGGDGDRRRISENSQGLDSYLGDDFRHVDVLANLSFDIKNPEGQQRQLVSDVVDCLLGFNGACIKAKPIVGYWDERKFTFADGIFPVLKGMAEKALQVASYCSYLRRFVSKNNRMAAGKINNALANNINHWLTGCFNDFCLLKSYKTLLSMWIHLQGFAKNMEHIYMIANNVVSKEATGTQTLSIVHNTIFYICFSVPHLIQEYSIMMVCTVLPFFEILGMWIYEGLLRDPSNEFMVVGNRRFEEPEGNGSLFPDEYWDHRFILDKSKVPPFLETVSDKIFLTGKYLDIIRQTIPLGRSFHTMAPIPLEYSVNGDTYLNPIEKAYSHANSYIVSLLIEDYKIYSYITLMKHVFFLEQGDLFGFLMDNCEKTLLQPCSEVCIDELNSSVESSFHCLSSHLDKLGVVIKSNLRKDSLEDQVRTIMSTTNKDKNKQDTNKDLLAIKCFTLNIELKWPECLILNRKAHATYQMIFRHFFYLKYVYTKLSRLIWFKKELGSKGHLLRNLMTLFLRELQHQTTAGQIEVNWIDFEAKLMKANSISEVIELHGSFLFDCMSSCLLNLPMQYASLVKVVDVCLAFASIPPDHLADSIDLFKTHFENAILNFDNTIKSYSYSKPLLFHLNPRHYLPKF